MPYVSDDFEKQYRSWSANLPNSSTASLRAANPGMHTTPTEAKLLDDAIQQAHAFAKDNTARETYGKVRVYLMRMPYQAGGRGRVAPEPLDPSISTKLCLSALKNIPYLKDPTYNQLRQAIMHFSRDVHGGTLLQPNSREVNEAYAIVGKLSIITSELHQALDAFA